MTDLINTTQFWNNTNILETVVALNHESGMLFATALYFVAGIVTIIGIKETTGNFESALAVGGGLFMILGLVLYIANGATPLVSAWAPLFFAAMGVIGVILHKLGSPVT